MTDNQNQLALPAGTIILNYRLQAVLGSGNFGIVYRGSNIYLDEVVAIKEFLPLGLAYRSADTLVVPVSAETEDAYAWALDRFHKEAKILWELGRPKPQPNIVQVKHFHKENGTAYMVMALEDGEPLSKILSEQGTLTQERIESIVYPILNGLERVHGALVWHRDIKPSNILVRLDDSPVLIDFGAAKQEIGNPELSTMAIYSPSYAPPEQITAVGKQGPWTDIYSLGATLYHAVLGNAPTYPLARREGSEHIPAIDAVSKGYSPKFLKAIDAAIELSVADRPQSILEFRNLLLDNRTKLRRKTPQASEYIPDAAHIESRNKAPIRWINPGSKYWWILTAGSTALLLLVTAIYVIPPRPTKNIETETIVSRDEIVRQITEILEPLACSYLLPKLTDSKNTKEFRLRVTGHVSSMSDLTELKKDLRALPTINQFDLNIKVYEPPFCKLIGVLQQYKSISHPREHPIRMNFNKQNRQYRIDDFLVVEVNLDSSYDGFLYVDYLDGGDQFVTHLFPSPVNPSSAVLAGENVVLGLEREVSYNASERSYKLQKPGENLVVAIYSKNLLFDRLRQEDERLDQYLPDLKRALEKLTEDQAPITAFEFITISSNR